MNAMSLITETFNISRKLGRDFACRRRQTVPENCTTIAETIFIVIGAGGKGTASLFSELEDFIISLRCINLEDK